MESIGVTWPRPIHRRSTLSWSKPVDKTKHQYLSPCASASCVWATILPSTCRHAAHRGISSSTLQMCHQRTSICDSNQYGIKFKEGRVWRGHGLEGAIRATRPSARRSNGRKAPQDAWTVQWTKECTRLLPGLTDGLFGRPGWKLLCTVMNEAIRWWFSIPLVWFLTFFSLFLQYDLHQLHFVCKNVSPLRQTSYVISLAYSNNMVLFV